MKNMGVVTSGMVAMMLSTATFAGPRENLIAQYAAAAKVSGFSAVRGQALYAQSFSGGKPDTPSCTTCHGKDIRGAGRALTGRTIEPMALSVSPTRYTDPAKVEKWFKRNCTEVLGRECTPQEKGDWLAFVIGQ
jgi:hypothetical protein